MRSSISAQSCASVPPEFLVVFLGSKLQQLTGILQRPGHTVERHHHLFKPHPFLTQLLGAFRVVPDVRGLQLAGNLD